MNTSTRLYNRAAAKFPKVQLVGKKIFIPKFTWVILFCKPAEAQTSQTKYLKMLLWKSQSEQKCDKMTKVMRD